MDNFGSALISFHISMSEGVLTFLNYSQRIRGGGGGSGYYLLCEDVGLVTFIPLSSPIEVIIE